MVDALETIRFIAVRKAYIYWSSSSGNIKRVPLAGGPIEPLFSPDAQATGPTVMALDDDAVYWHDGKQVFAMPSAGGAPRMLALSDDGAKALFADASSTELFLGQDHGVAAVPKAGGPLRQVRVFPPDPSKMVTPLLAGASAGLIYTFEPEGHLFESDGGQSSQYWFTTALRRTAVTGGPAEPVAWMRSGELLAIDGSDLYWTQSSNDALALMRLSAQGGPPSWLSNWGYGSLLMTDANYIYQSTWEWQCKMQILRTPKAGGASQLLVASVPVSRDLMAAVGAGKLFWVTGETGSTIRSLDL